MKQNPKVTVTPATKKQLDAIRLVPNETYDHIIQRLLNVNESVNLDNPYISDG